MTKHTRKWIIFTLVSLITFLVYFITTSPTIVFWDVGEFLATSVIFGVPHPPGTPLYVVLGRFMTILPLPLAPLYHLLTGSIPVNNVLKITLISMSNGALTAGFIYLITFEVIDHWHSKFPEGFAHIAGIFAGFIGAFARTVWMNSIEAETYTPSVFVIAFLVWVTLKWYDNREQKDSIRYLLFTLYVLFLSSGIHLMPLVYFPVLFIFVWIIEPKLIWDLEFLGTFGLAGILISALEILYEPSFKWYALFAIGVVMVYYYLEKRNIFKEGGWALWAGILGLVITVFGMLTKSFDITWAGALLFFVGSYIETKLYKDWKGFALILIIIGVSAELVLILRAIHNPSINEADPSNFKAFMDVLTRKQYGPGGVFPRNIPWIDQFKVYWLYWSWQYKELLIPITLLGIFGMITHYSNDKDTFILVFGTFLILSLGLLVYLNLKDSPTHPIHAWNPREVRDRDYFYAGAYTFFGLYAGIGLWEVLRLLWVNIKEKFTLSIGVLGGALAFFMVVAQLKAFYPIVNRNHNYVAADYAHDLLASPEGRSVLFTNGDNDTFPLWAAQEVLRDRTDVINANLSYLNTGWYCVQLKKKGAPISLPDKVLLNMPPAIVMPDGSMLLMRDIVIKDMIATSVGYKPKKYRKLQNVEIPEIYFDNKRFVKEVLDGRHLNFPLYFATSCDPNVYKIYTGHLVLQGLAFKLVGKKVTGIKGPAGDAAVDLERTDYLLHGDIPVDTFFKKYKYAIYKNDVFRYRGMIDTTVYKDGAHLLVLKNIAAVSLHQASYAQYMMRMDTTKKDYYFKKAEDGLKIARIMTLNIMPFENRRAGILAYVDQYLAELYRRAGMYKKAIFYINEAQNYLPNPAFATMKGITYYDMGLLDSALIYLNMSMGMQRGKTLRENYLYLGKIYLEKGDTQKAKDYLSKIKLDINDLDTMRLR